MLPAPNDALAAARTVLRRRANIARLSCLAVLAALNLADLWSTRFLLDRGGVEANPVMASVADSLLSGFAIKAVCLVAIAAVLLQFPAERRAPIALLGGLIGWYGFVVAWNLHLAASLPA